VQKRHIIWRSLLIVTTPYVNQPCVWYDSSMCVTWLTCVWGMTYLCVWQNSFMFVTWLMYVFDMRYLCLRDYMCDMTHSHLWHVVHTGWQKPIGCLKLQVIFCKRATNYRALLRKMTCEDKASYESSPPCMRGMTYLCAWHDSCMFVTWLIYVCDVIRVTWRIHMCDMTRSLRMWDYIFDMTHSHFWHDSFICVVWLIYAVDMTHVCLWHDSFMFVELYVWHNAFTFVSWLVHMGGMNHSYVWHDSLICVAWLINTCDMTYLYVWRDVFIRVTWLIPMALICVT